ncbi:MAG: PAS domain S-box protein [Planctomycetaceae bacterium]|nr:PAS domain S-box protein [Planctomycetaceae bacterium]
MSESSLSTSKVELNPTQIDALLRAVVDNASDAIFVKDLNGNYLLFNQAAADCVSVPVEQVIGRSDDDLFDRASAEWLRAHDQSVIRSGGVVTAEERLTVRGVERVYSATKAPYRDATGNIVGLIGISRDITERKQAEEFLAQQNALLEKIALDAPLAEILTGIVQLIETQTPGVVGSVLLLDAASQCLHLAAAPGLPDDYNRAVDGVKIGPQVGSCGTAAFLAQPVFVADVLNDPHWDHLSDEFKSHGLRACWSIPILSRKENAARSPVLGTFALYAPEPGLPDERMIALMARAEYLACIAIEADRAAQALRSSEARFRAFVDHAADAFFLHAQGGIISDANQQACDSLGYGLDELIGQMPTMFDVGVQPGIMQEITRQLNANQTVTFETVHQRKDGSRFPVEVRIRPFYVGATRHSISLVRDISHQKQSQANLSQSVSRLKATLESTADGILVVDLEGRMVEFNEQFVKTWRMPPELLVRGRDTDLVALANQDLAMRHIFEQLSDPQAFIDRVQVLYAAPLQTSFDVIPFKDGRMIERFSRPQLIDGRAVGRVWSFRDVTDRHRAEQSLRKSEKEFRTLAQHLPAIITRIDRSLRIHYINDAVSSLLGLEPTDIIGRSLGELGLPETFVAERAKEIQHAIATGVSTRVRHTLTHSGSESHYDVQYVPERDEAGTVVGLLTISVDITAQKQLEDQLRQSQKMEAIGRLAGGIAHDFNNLLTVILASSELLATSLPGVQESVLREVQEIRHAAQRATGLTRQLLAFSRQQMLKPVVLDPNEVVSRTESLLHRVIGEDITLTTSLSANLGLIEADPGQLEQVLINLAINARDAMPRGGTLSIATRRQVEATGEAWVELRVTDTGVGIPSEVLPRIFDPFFTTKEVGKGTGLGLAVVHGIVEQSGGKVRVQSQPGEGTTFNVLLPTTKRTAAATPTPPGTTHQPGSETVLVVDDEVAICSIIAQVLRSQGYTVLVASSAAEALKLVEQHPHDIHLLITDVVMPQVSGEQLAQQVRQLRPAIQVVYMSGYFERETRGDRPATSIERLLPKPFTPQELKTIVRQSLDQA